MIAIGQPSTDSVRAHGEHPMSLRATLIRSRYPAVQDHWVLRRQNGVTRHPSRSQRRPETAHAVPKTRPTVGGQAATRQKVRFCTAPTGVRSPHLLESMRLKFSDPTQQPHRPPREDREVPHIRRLWLLSDSEVASSKLVFTGLHLRKKDKSRIHIVVSWPAPSAR